MSDDITDSMEKMEQPEIKKDIVDKSKDVSGIIMRTMTSCGIIKKTCKVLDETEEYYIYKDENDKKSVIEKDSEDVRVYSIVLSSRVR